MERVQRSRAITREQEDVPPLPSGATTIQRFSAGVADLLVHGAVLLLPGPRAVGHGNLSRQEQAPAFALFLLAFSFPYTAVALAFWGQTPGMSVAGIAVCTPGGRELDLASDRGAMGWQRY